MTTSEMEHVEQVGPDLAPLLFVPHIEAEYQRLIALLDSLIDRVGALIERFEDERVPELG